MARVAPINLPYNIKTLWFDPGELEIHANDKVVVQTERGLEMGVAASDIIDVEYEQIKALKCPLKPVERIATPEDEAQAAEMERLSKEAMPTFKKLARETSEDMHPVSVEYMLDGDKAVFYFESEERIDFRDLVRKLAAEFHVRIDMRQIGVRDEARIVGGIAHCGQIVCCKRLGGEFKPVSIRMAKDQDLSLNPQKISGLCGRLMCCLRYENNVYKEFKAKAPKKDALIETPDGEGRVVDYDVPRDTISVKVEEEKPIKVPLSAFEEVSENRKEAKVDPKAWEKAVEETQIALYEGSELFNLPNFTGEDKLGAAKAIHREQSEKDDDSSKGKSKKSSSRTPRRRSQESEPEPKRTPRRRSTKITAGGTEKETTVDESREEKKQSPRGADKRQQKKSSGTKLRPGHKSSGLAHSEEGESKHASRKQRPKQNKPKQQEGAKHPEAKQDGERKPRRRRRRSHGHGGQQGGENPASGSSGKQKGQR